MFIKIKNCFMCGLIMLMASSVLYAIAPDITGGRLECKGDSEIVVQILQMIKRGHPQDLYSVDLYINGEHIINPDGKPFGAFAISNNDESKS